MPMISLRDVMILSWTGFFVTHSGIDQKIIDLAVSKVREHQPGVKEIFVTKAAVRFRVTAGRERWVYCFYINSWK